MKQFKNRVAVTRKGFWQGASGILIDETIKEEGNEYLVQFDDDVREWFPESELKESN